MSEAGETTPRGSLRRGIGWMLVLAMALVALDIGRRPQAWEPRVQAVGHWFWMSAEPDVVVDNPRR